MSEPLRILILEDSPADAEMIQFELQEAGIVFAPKVVMTEEDFVRAIQEFSPDLILSDYDLPKYSGALALAEANQRCPDTPFILVTGAVTEDRAIDILTQGAKDYVLKNRLGQRLVPAVRRALAEAEEHRARSQAEAELREAHRTLEERVKSRTAELEAEMAAHKKTEESLRDSEERQRLVLQASSIGTFEVDLLTGEGQWNATEFELLGLKPGDVKASPDVFFRYVHPDDVGQLQSDWEEATRTGKLDSEFRIVRADGRECWLAGKGSFIFDGHPDGDDTGASGKPRRFMGVNFDITERRKAEETLRESEARLRGTLRSVADEIWIIDTQGCIVSLSDSVRENLGVGSDKWVDIESALDQLEILRPDGTPRPREDTPLSRALRGEVIRNEGEMIRNLATGQLRWREVSGTPVRDEEGRIIGAVVVVRDITERKQAEEQLRQSQWDLEQAQMVGQVGSWRLDTLRNILTWSDENHRIFGLPKGTPMSYETFLSTIHPDDRQYVDTQWQAGLRGEPYDIEHRIVVADQVKWVREKAYLEFDAVGQLLGGFGITQDITARKQAEIAFLEQTKQLEAANKELESFSYSVSHDLKAPLRAIDGYSRMFIKKYGSMLDEDATRLLNVIPVVLN